MLPADPAAVPAGRPEARPPGAICLVARGECLKDEADTLARARELTAEGWRVRVLLCAPRRAGRALAWELCRQGIAPEWLEDAPQPPAARLPNALGDGAADLSDRVRHSLEQMHGRCGLDAVEFPALEGMAFRSVQAQRCGLAFEGVVLAVRLNTCSSWLRLQQKRWPDGAEHLRVDHLERYSFEHAGQQVTPCPALLAHVRERGWLVRDGDEVGPAASPPAEEQPLVTVCIAHYNLGRHLPTTLASLERQTYPNFEVVVIDDGSTDAASVAVFAAMAERHRRFRFLRQENAGVGAARNRGLAEARGRYFVPVDADNVACPDMLERFVDAAQRRPELAALSCYFLAFESDEALARQRFAYAYRPTGGPHVLSCLRNVYGDANALFRTDSLRSVGGFEPDRGTSYEDWEAFVKLVHAGHAVDVLPDALFYYRHLPGGFSRTTDHHANQLRVVRQFARLEGLPPGERELLWHALVGAQMRVEHQEACLRSRRYRIADGVYGLCRLATRGLRAIVAAGIIGGRPGRRGAAKGRGK